MQLYFSESIKRLRKERELTQESLADFLGVTFQAVSKWERGESYPDIELLPTIADFFSVSTDELLGVDRAKNEAEILRIIEAYDNLTDDEAKHCIIVDAMKKFPNDFRLQLRRMSDLAFYKKGTDFHDNLPKVRAIYDNIQSYCRIDTVRICAKRYLAIYYSMLSEYEDSGITFDDCEKIINEMPYMRDGQEFLRSYLFPHDTEAWKEHDREAIEEEISLLCHGIAHLFDVTDESNHIDDLINGVQTEIQLLQLFYDDGNYGRAWRNIIFSYGYLGYLYCKTGDTKNGLRFFRKEAALAKQFDSLERITVMHSRFFEGREFDKHTLGSTFVACSRVKYLLEEKYPLLDAFKATPAFQELVHSLSA
ncbi:MAG: helix-turn-helix transcriptional regulator [Eubacterium sp.]|nr:helix-turn-helix transcriptional regulator [Eubacterium sp.]